MTTTKGALGLWTVVLLIFVPTFGFRNITNNTVALGAASIPSWLIVALMFFLPLSIIIAELASSSSNKGGGLYSWIESGLGDRWAFIGTWSYFVAGGVGVDPLAWTGRVGLTIGGKGHRAATPEVQIGT